MYEFLLKNFLEKLSSDNLVFDNTCLKSKEWCLGGHWNDCWESHEVEAEYPKDFDELYELINEITDKIITDKEYKDINNLICYEEYYSDGGSYYGGKIEMAYNYIIIDVLIDYLQSKNLLI